MSPEQAITVLENVTAQQPLIRQDQLTVMQALAVLKLQFENKTQVNTQFNTQLENNSKNINKEE